MNNGSECNPGGCHGLQSRCPDESWEVGSIPTRFRNHFMLLILLFISSFIFPQGMYLDNEDKSVYSINAMLGMFNGSHDPNGDGVMNDYTDNKYGLSLSAIINANNELSLGYEKNEESKSITGSYIYYIRPQFYFKILSGISYEHIQKTNSNENKYIAKIGFYGKKNDNRKSQQPLKYFPFFIYNYILHEVPANVSLEECTRCYYDSITIGFSILFNDIGIEPSYSWIDKNTSELSLKVYLWEFGS